MSADSFFASAVEVAIAIAGFAGIVAAIRHRDISRWAHEEQILLRMLLTASGMSISFALLPAVLAEAHLPEPTIWRIGSASLLVWQIGIWVHRSRQLRAVGTARATPMVLRAWVLVAVVLQALNIELGTSWPYLLGIFSILLNAFTFFLILLFGRATGEQGAG